MKIAPKAAESFLQSPDARHRAALIYGPDAGLARERARRIREAALKGSGDPFAFVELEEATLLDDPARLSDELSAISLMGGKRVIQLTGGDKLTKIIEGAASALNNDAFLLVLGGDLPSRSSLRAFFEKGDGVASLACYRDETRDVQGIVRQKLSEAGIALERDALDWLAGQLGNDRYVTYQELEKIILYAGENKAVSLEEVMALVDYNRDSGLDDVVNAAAAQDLQALDAMIAVQLREGASPVAWLRALQRYFNRLYLVRAQMAAGRGLEEAIQGLRPPVFFKQLPLMTRHAERWDLPMIVRALKLLIEAELACKTSHMPPAAASHRKLMQLTQVR